MSGLPKGPWSASLDGHGAFSIESASGNQICFVRNAEAANLIAAAPELLEALRDLIGWVPGPAHWHTDACPKAVDRAVAALAKALGGAA